MFGIVIVGIAAAFGLSFLGGAVVTAIRRNSNARVANDTNTTSETNEENNKEKNRSIEEQRVNEEDREVVDTVEENKLTVEEAVNAKMNSKEVKKLVGNDKEKEKYLRAILTNAATKQFNNGNSLEELMNNKAFNEKLIPNVCEKIDKYLSLKSLTEEKLDKFYGLNESNVSKQIVALRRKLGVLEKQLLENKQSFMSDAEMYEAGLDESIANMSVNSHMSYVMETIEGLKTNTKKLSESMQKVESKLEEHGYDLKMLEKLDLVGLKNKVDELEKNGLTEDDIKTIFVTKLNTYFESKEFVNIVENITKNTETKVTYRITPAARTKIVAEIYNTIINEGNVDDKTLKESITGVVKDIIENKLQVKKTK